MTPTQYKSAIDRLGLSQVGAARLLGLDPRTSRRFASGEAAVPQAVALALRLMIEHGVTPDEAEKLAR